MNHFKRHHTSKPFLSPQVKELITMDEERVTIVHCRHFIPHPSSARIWPTTYLIENNGTTRGLLHAIDIVFAPKRWLYHLYAEYIYFTLIFERLSDDCVSFHLEEIIQEPNGFISDETPRNENDIYQVELFAP